MKQSPQSVPVYVILVLMSSTTGSPQAPKPMTTGRSMKRHEGIPMMKLYEDMPPSTYSISTSSILTAVILVSLFCLLGAVATLNWGI